MSSVSQYMLSPQSLLEVQPGAQMPLKQNWPSGHLLVALHRPCGRVLPPPPPPPPPPLLLSVFSPPELLPQPTASTRRNAIIIRFMCLPRESCASAPAGAAGHPLGKWSARGLRSGGSPPFRGLARLGVPGRPSGAGGTCQSWHARGPSRGDTRVSPLRPGSGTGSQGRPPPPVPPPSCSPHCG